MDIRISQTYPKIGIETSPAKLQIRNNGRTDYKISHTDSKVQIDSTEPKLYIDQSQCFADEGLKGIKDFSNEISSYAYQNALNYIAKKAEDGDALAKIENGGRPVLDIIHSELNPTTDYNVGLMPEHRPEISVEPGSVDIQVREGKINTAYNEVPLDINFTPPSINIYLLQKGSVKIEYVGKNFDAKI